jgi:hypothetical protein
MGDVSGLRSSKVGDRSASEGLGTWRNPFGLEVL